MSTQTTVLVTGASGFIASHCIISLLNQGYRVIGTVRSLQRTQSINDTLRPHTEHLDQLSFIEADLEQSTPWAAAVQNVDYVLHVASPLPRVMPKDPQELIKPARDGAIRVLKAACEAGVKRVVMTASTASIVYGRGNINRPFTEQDWSDAQHKDNSAYTISKTLAERAAWEFMESQNSNTELVTINPGAVLGPVLEQDYGTSAEIVYKLMKGDFPGNPQLGFPLVDVRDIADLHIKAMTSDKAAGQRFLAANDFMWMGDIAQVLRDHVPQYANKIPSRNLPNWLMRLVSFFDPVVKGVTFELGIRRECDTSKAKTLLGWQPRDNHTAIKATADSLIAQGLV